MKTENIVYREVGISTKENDEELLREKQAASQKGIQLVFMQTGLITDPENEAMMLMARVRHLNKGL